MCYSCNYCNRCGRVDRMMREWSKKRSCPVCGTEVEDDARNCPQCKAPLPPATKPPGA